MRVFLTAAATSTSTPGVWKWLLQRAVNSFGFDPHEKHQNIAAKKIESMMVADGVALCWLAFCAAS
ncbi:hypothetical protein KCP70_22795 [Salmonella enterica subsp. enterica]|nr:hypothetical protein KCP70_22795 [Salmonella enterica subsp. enterica]